MNSGFVSTVHQPEVFMPVLGLNEVTNNPKVGIVQIVANRMAAKLAQGLDRCVLTLSISLTFLRFRIFVIALLSLDADGQRYKPLKEAHR